ncbi:MAG: bile acid:sodium symporter [Deltaproteobacteria bacterium]|nr:bile acid:sodium symporter [Deltaproteobacteria bacterium]
MKFRLLLLKYWFFTGIAAVVLIAFALPAVGVFLQTYKILDIVIFVAFLLTGLTLEMASIVRQLKNAKALIAAVASSLFLFPIIAYWPAVWIFGTPSDAAIGALINGVAPVTIASGMVMTAVAFGNVPLSLLICVLCNTAAVLTIPFMLDLLLGAGGAPVSLPAMQMLTGLAVKVLLPTVIGQLLRPLLKDLLVPYGKVFSIFNQCLVLMIILNAVSSSTDRIIEAGIAILGIFIFMILLHVCILLMNYGVSRLIRLDQPSTAAFTIHVSQKTLTVSYLVWSGYFAGAFPMALIPAIAYHITQMIMDTFVADWFRRVQMEIEGTDKKGVTQ